MPSRPGTGCTVGHMAVPPLKTGTGKQRRDLDPLQSRGPVDESSLETLRTDFPDYQIWQAGSTWVATRRNAKGLELGVDATVCADSLGELAGKLAEQRSAQRQIDEGRWVQWAI